jgi:hypothetical protein
MKQITKKALVSVVLAGLACVPLQAQTVDLSTGDSGTVNGSIFNWTDTQPTGTGYIDSFVRIQNKGVEEGYNTSGRPFAFDEKDPLNYTHDVQMKDLATANVGGNAYYQFLLDINEAGSSSKQLLSMDSLQFYTSPTGSKTTADVSTLGTLRYDLDAGGDHWILLNSSRNSGSGSGDMVALVPTSLFSGASADDYVYLYSKFGLNASSDAGFEEWATFGDHTSGGGPSAVPEPSTYAVLGSLLAFVIYLKRRSGHAENFQVVAA